MNLEVPARLTVKGRALEQTDFFTVRFTVKRLCWDQVLRAASATDLLIDQALGDQLPIGDDSAPKIAATL
jgi:hypothetical protein